MQQKNRIASLDGFRFFAILSVVLYHYYSRWIPHFNSGLYPYGNKYSYFPYGYLGVEFFFIISGFVIAYTLFATDNLGQFWKKRMIRLFPSMFVCSLITLLFFTFEGNDIFPDANRIPNFFGSLTFLSPGLIKNISLGHIKFEYLNGSYWSLWPELQFYFIASLIYYYKPVKFIKSFSIVSICIYALYWVIQNINGTNTFRIPSTPIIPFINTYLHIFDVSIYILYFSIGVLFYNIYTKNHNRYTIGVLALTILLQFHSNVAWQAKLGFAIMICVFLVFIYFPAALNFLTNSVVKNIGLASYTLYLIHEDIGVFLIHKYAAYWGRFDFLFPIFLFILFVAFSLASYWYIEKPINRYLKQKFISK